MATGRDFVEGALKRIGVVSAESSIQAVDLQDGLEVFNDMMSELEPTLKFGFETIADAGDTVRVPRGAHAAIKSNLAVRLAADYGKQVNPALVAESVASMENLLRSIVFIGDVKFPDTLPLGSGNQCTTFEDQRFFPENQEENF